MSVSIFTRSTDISRFNLDAATSTPGSNNPTGMFQRVSVWLGSSGMFQVSGFDLLLLFVVETLNLELYRPDLDSITSPSLSNESNDSIGLFWIILGWLHYAGMFQVSCFDFLRLADFYSFDLESSVSMAMPNVSIWTICMVDGWHR